MDSAGYYWGLYRGYCKDPFPHSLLSTSQFKDSIHGFQSLTGFKVQLFCWGGGGSVSRFRFGALGCTFRV